VASVVLSPKTPINVWKDGLLIIVYYSENTAAYFWSPLSNIIEEKMKRGLSAFSTNLIKKHVDFDIFV
jgi:hypothetical protein